MPIKSIEHVILIRAIRRGYILKGGIVDGPFGQKGVAQAVDDVIFENGHEVVMFIELLQRLECNELTV